MARTSEKKDDVVPSRKPKSWEEFFELMKGVEFPEDFLTEDDRDAAKLKPAAPTTAPANAPDSSADVKQGL